VHVLAPGKPDRTTTPQPSSGSMTCHWDLSDGQPQLAIAARASAALWTLHESGPAPFDYVLTAPIGGPENRVDRLAHASDGTGKWLGGVTGSGHTLAYSWVDIEYIDKLACLSGGSCAQKIAGGGIRLASATGAATALPGGDPALALAAAAGRIAYIPATTVGKNGQPATDAGTPIEVVDAVSGDGVSHVTPRGVPLAIALSPNVLAVLAQLGDQDRISWYDPIEGTKLGSVAVSPDAASMLAADDELIVYRVGRFVHSVTTDTGRVQTITKTGPAPVGPSLESGELVWAESSSDGSRLRAVAVP
jgi:hypothetical protein